jgi:biotin carboxyl carrier protein
MEESESKMPSDQIWSHDAEIQTEALDFYSELESKLGKSSTEVMSILGSEKNPDSKAFSDTLWTKCLESHKAFQIGMEILKLIPAIGDKSAFHKLDINSKLDAVVPEEFTDPAKVKEFIKSLNPPPKAKSDEIVAPMGGMFYSREAPTLPILIEEGSHFEAGQPLFIIEVMKMFNKISAPFSGTIVKNQMDDSDGKIVSKGQTIFKVQPDEVVKEESVQEIQERKIKITNELFSY